MNLISVSSKPYNQKTMPFSAVKKVADADFPTRWGSFRILGFEGIIDRPEPCNDDISAPAKRIEGAVALVDWGFRNQGYDKIVSCTMAVNRGSRRVMEKLGMRHARTIPCEGVPFPGTEHGDVWYELTRAEWNGAANRLERME